MHEKESVCHLGCWGVVVSGFSKGILRIISARVLGENNAISVLNRISLSFSGFQVSD